MYILGLHTCSKKLYYHYPGWHQPSAVFEYLVHNETMNTLSKEQKSILIAAATNSSLYFTLHLQSENELALERMIEKGVETHAFPDELLKELYESSKATLIEECSKDSFSHEVMLSYKSYLTRMRQWGPMSSGGIWKWRTINSSSSKN